MEKKSKNLSVEATPEKKGHWEVNVDLTPAGDNTPAGAFLPKRPSKRPTMHVKTNECDH